MRLASIAAVLLLALPAALAAQRGPGVRAEARVQATLARPDASTGAGQAALHLLAGAAIPFGSYVRLSAVAGPGVARADGGATTGSAHAEALARFTLDPFRRARWGLSLGGGVAARHAPVEGTTARLVLAADVELPRASGVVPYVQVGLGGGVRVAIGIRGASRDWR